MFRIFARLITIIFTFFLITTSLSRLLTYDESYSQQLQIFLASSDSCDSNLCFLGIILGQADYYAITAVLEESQYIGDFDIVDTHAQFQYADWEWSGTQPSFFEKTGHLRFRDNLATQIVLTPELTLGEIWLTFGDPTAITENTVHLFFRYIERGFVVRTIPNCNDIWRSSVEIVFDEYIYRPISENLPLSEALNNLCHRH